MSKWIDQRIPRAPYDDVPFGMWVIVSDGRSGFGLEGEALANYIRKSIHALMDAGFEPVRGAGKPDQWKLQVQYGSNKYEVAEAVIAEWLRDGAPTPEPWTGLWFGLPRHWLPENRRSNGTAGCDKRFATCRDRFANGGNFRGFPHVPGNDFVISYPVPGRTGGGSA